MLFRSGLDTAGRVTVLSHWPTWPKVPGGAPVLRLLAGPASAGRRAFAGCLGFRGARGLLGQADGDVHVGSTVLLEVASSLLFIFLPGDPDVLVVQVVQGPVASTVPGVQHRVRGQLNLKHEQSSHWTGVSHQGPRTECSARPATAPTFCPQKYTRRRAPFNSKTGQDYLCTPQTELSEMPQTLQEITQTRRAHQTRPHRIRGYQRLYQHQTCHSGWERHQLPRLLPHAVDHKPSGGETWREGFPGLDPLSASRGKQRPMRGGSGHGGKGASGEMRAERLTWAPHDAASARFPRLIRGARPGSAAL